MLREAMRAEQGSARSERGLLSRLAVELHGSGAPADDLEAAVQAVGRTMAQEVQVFASPTALQLDFGEGASGARLLRVRPGDVHLARLADLQDWIRQVVEGRLLGAEARRRFHEIVDSSPRYGPALELAAFAGASATAAPLFGGGAVEIAIAALLGLVTGLLARACGRRPEFARLLAPIAAAGTAVAAAALASVHPLAQDSVVLAALIVLVPGFTVTVALQELAGGHLVSGTARLAGGTITLMGLGFGVAVGRAIAARWIPGAGDPPVPELAGAWTWLALGLAPICFAVLFQARRRDAPGIVLVALGGFAIARWGGAALGAQLGTFVGALGVGLLGELLGGLFRRSAAVYTVPGILLLVPGSVGFRSVASFLESDVLSGVDGAFRMIMIGASLALGLLGANAIRGAWCSIKPDPGSPKEKRSTPATSEPETSSSA